MTIDMTKKSKTTYYSTLIKSNQTNKVLGRHLYLNNLLQSRMTGLLYTDEAYTLINNIASA